MLITKKLKECDGDVFNPFLLTKQKKTSGNLGEGIEEKVERTPVIFSI